MLATGHKANFETLQAAFDNGDVALMECQLASTGEPVAVLCPPTASPMVKSSSPRLP